MFVFVFLNCNLSSFVFDFTLAVALMVLLDCCLILLHEDHPLLLAVSWMLQFFDSPSCYLRTWLQCLSASFRAVPDQSDDLRKTFLQSGRVGGSRCVGSVPRDAPGMETHCHERPVGVCYDSGTGAGSCFGAHSRLSSRFPHCAVAVLVLVKFGLLGVSQGLKGTQTNQPTIRRT